MCRIFGAYIAHGLASCHTRARLYINEKKQLRRYIVLQGCDAWNRRYVTFFTIPGISSSIDMILFVRFRTRSLTVKSVWCLCVWSPLHTAPIRHLVCRLWPDDAIHAFWSIASSGTTTTWNKIWATYIPSV